MIKKSFYIAVIIAALFALFLASFIDYETAKPYYKIVRWIVFISAISIIFIQYKNKKWGYLETIFVLLAGLIFYPDTEYLYGVLDDIGVDKLEFWKTMDLLFAGAFGYLLVRDKISFSKIWQDFTPTEFWLYQWIMRWKYRDFFEKIEKHPFTKLQRNAIILNQKRNLIIAGAGTGKTSTIIGKIGYLIKTGKAHPKEILVLAYNKNIQEELKRKLKSRQKYVPDIGITKIDLKTFHALGKEIIEKTDKKTHTVARFVEQDKEYSDFLNKIIQEISQDEEARSILAKYFSEHLIPYKDEEEFTSFAQYINWVKSENLQTLNGEMVKSFGEWLIANYLFVNGIEYVYEKIYEPINNRKKLKDFVYKPDFFLPGHDAYIEYLGIDKWGNTRADIDKQKYNEQIKWKRKAHKEGGTKLIEISYENVKNNDWNNVLKGELKKLKVQKSRLSLEQILEKANHSKNYKDRFTELLKNFLDIFKSAPHDIKKLKREAIDERTYSFLEIFEKIYEAYTHTLDSNKEIDFNDMIRLATEYIRDGRFIGKWKYIIIDEFQDISQGRYMLINTLLRQNQKGKLY
ncbi:MAG: UvrD-helicase domain-containing protein, partial [Parvibaculales bacterium]